MCVGDLLERLGRQPPAVRVLGVAVAPAGNPVTLSSTSPAKPFAPDTETVYEPLPDRDDTLRVGGLAVRAKSPAASAATVTARAADVVVAPELSMARAVNA